MHFMWCSNYMKFPQKASLAVSKFGTLKVNMYKSSTPKICSRHLNLDSHFHFQKRKNKNRPQIDWNSFLIQTSGGNFLMFFQHSTEMQTKSINKDFRLVSEFF